MSFDGQTAWVTGGSGAIGRAIAKCLASKGANVTITSRDLDKLQTVRAALQEETGKALDCVAADLTQRESVEAAFAEIIARQGRLDLLVNSATAPHVGRFEELDDWQWQSVIETKVLGYMRVMRAVLPSMRRQKFGRIVNISGGSAGRPSDLHLPGGGANAMIHHLSKGLANIYGASNIRINVVAPGPIASDRLEMMANAASANASPGVSRDSVLQSPLGRLGEPSDIADAVAFLLSDRSAFITGDMLYVDGGRRPGP